MNIDRKYHIEASNPTSGSHHTEQDSILFLAKDAAVPDMLDAYSQKCIELGCSAHHLKSVELLRERVVKYQAEQGSKTADTTLAENTVYPEELGPGVISP